MEAIPIWLQIFGALVFGFWLGTTLMYRAAIRRIYSEREKLIDEFMEMEFKEWDCNKRIEILKQVKRENK
jgi:hypothetical protein